MKSDSCLTIAELDCSTSIRLFDGGSGGGGRGAVKRYSDPAVGFRQFHPPRLRQAAGSARSPHASSPLARPFNPH